jgi:hypothetical protein
MYFQFYILKIDKKNIDLFMWHMAHAWYNHEHIFIPNELSHYYHFYNNKYISFYDDTNIVWDDEWCE